MTVDESTDRVEQAATRVGRVLDGSWRVESLLGLGGMAAVYAASAGEERVALKVLHPDLARSQRALDRFRREGDALRAAQHPAVPRVHAEGTAKDGCPYLAMDLLLGETVEARRRRFGGRLAWAEVVHIAIRVLDVLDAAHGRGVLHRDIKPSNVMWLDDGSIRLIDFGIAKTKREDDALAVTRTGAVPGSLAFMSPEHALGVPSSLDGRSDIWSLGATMFLLLSGRPVHESQTEVEALARTASRKARPLGSVTRDIPPALSAVVDRALAFEPRKRFADAAEMREAIRRSAMTSAARPPARRRWGATLATAGAIGLCGIGVLAGWYPSGGTSKEGAPEVEHATPGASASSGPRPVTSVVLAEREVASAPHPAKDRAAGDKPARPPRSVRRSPRESTPGPASSANPSTPTTPMASRCDPPFSIDPTTGTRRVKPGC